MSKFKITKIFTNSIIKDWVVDNYYLGTQTVLFNYKGNKIVIDFHNVTIEEVDSE